MILLKTTTVRHDEICNKQNDPTLTMNMINNAK